MFGLKIFRYITKFFAIIFIVAFVVLNQQETTFYYSPLATPLILPMWGMGLVLFGIGFTFGALLLWFNSWPSRRELRKTKKELQQVESERDELLHKDDEPEIRTLEYKDTHE